MFHYTPVTRSRCRGRGPPMPPPAGYCSLSKSLTVEGWPDWRTTLLRHERYPALSTGPCWRPPCRLPATPRTRQPSPLPGWRVWRIPSSPAGQMQRGLASSRAGTGRTPGPAAYARADRQSEEEWWYIFQLSGLIFKLGIVYESGMHIHSSHNDFD